MRRILATSIAAAIPAVLPVLAVDAFAKPAPQPGVSGHSRTAPRAHGHAGHVGHSGHVGTAPVGETRDRPARGPENDVKVDADDGSDPAGAQGSAQDAPEHGATGHGASQARGPRKATRNRPARGSHNSASRPGTGADSGFADADEAALPPEASAAIKEADGLQHSAGQAAGSNGSGQDDTQKDQPAAGAPKDTAPSQAPAQAPGAAQGGSMGSASTAPKGAAEGRPANPPADKSTNRTSNRRMSGSVPVAFFSGPVARGAHLVLHMTSGTSPQHTVTLQCDPAGGTHPNAAQACDDVAKAGGDLAQMPTSSNPRACFMIYAPVTATAKGEWQGHPVNYTKKFPNTCVMRDKTGSVFDF